MLMEKLLISADEGLICTSWEPGRINQYYFLTTKEDGKEADKWLDTTMNYFLTKYGINICQDRLSTGIPKMPRSETKVQLNSFVMNYIKTLGIDEEMIGGKGGHNRAPLSTQAAKKRALVIYG